MIEVLWHGRGGQGAFTAAKLLGAAGTQRASAYALAFPSFGPERRGAPMRAFTKLDSAPIGDRSAIVHADIAVYLDETLFTDSFAHELKPDGIAVVNSSSSFDDPRVISLDADALAQEILGRPIVNTALLGALCSLNDAVSVEDVQQAIRDYMAPKLQECNCKIAAAAFESMQKAGERNE